jgi:hypothetical protein
MALRVLRMTLHLLRIGLAAPGPGGRSYGSSVLIAWSRPDIWSFRQGEVDE